MSKKDSQRKKLSSSLGFTLIEIIIVFAIMGAVLGFVSFRIGSFTFWGRESFIRKLRETIVFLHYQAISDQKFYRIDFFFPPFEPSYWRVTSIDATHTISDDTAQQLQDAGHLSVELATFLNPTISDLEGFSAPANFPSLSEPVRFPDNIMMQDIRTPRGDVTPERNGEAYIIFSPRGFSEFAVIHLRVDGQPYTIMVNPFMGNTDLYRDYREFAWSYS